MFTFFSFSSPDRLKEIVIRRSHKYVYVLVKVFTIVASYRTRILFLTLLLFGSVHLNLCLLSRTEKIWNNRY